MLSSLKVRLALGLMTLMVAGIGYTQMPAQKSEAAVTSLGYFNFSYSTVTGLGTWNIRLTINDTFTQNYNFFGIFPDGSIVTSATAPLTCTGLPRPAPVDCTLPFPPGGTLVELTITTPYAQLCTAQTVVIGPWGYTNTNINMPVGIPVIVPGSTQSNVGGVLVNNVVPANTALCPTPVPNTPIPSTPTPTPTPVVVVPPPVIPQVFQHVPQGIFNGTRNNTPTPVRPVGTAGSTGVGLPPAGAGAMPAVRPPSTGDAGLAALYLSRLNAW